MARVSAAATGRKAPSAARCSMSRMRARTAESIAAGRRGVVAAVLSDAAEEHAEAVLKAERLLQVFS